MPVTHPNPERLVKTWSKILPVALAAAALAGAGAAPRHDHPVTFAGGRDLGRDDHGRPCVLIAAALGVGPAVFREAFAGVTPAKGRGPSGAEARKNKEALLKVLGPHGVTSDRLDEVSNYYRFRPQEGELWTHAPAKAHAVVENGAVARVVVDDGGSGYTTPPKVTVPGFEKVEFVATLHFDKELKKNGSVESVTLKE